MLRGIFQTFDDFPLDGGAHCVVGSIAKVLGSSFQCILGIINKSVVVVYTIGKGGPLYMFNMLSMNPKSS